MDAWYTAADLAGRPGLPGTPFRVRERAERERWPSRKRAKGKGLEYPFSALPPATRAALLLAKAQAEEPVAPRRARMDAATPQVIEAAWQRYEAATETRRADAVAAAAALDAVQALADAGQPLGVARETVAAQCGCSSASLQRWAREVRGAERPDWPALLLDDYVGRTAVAPCDELAWDWYRGAYLDRSQPTHAECYRRLIEVAKAQGWTVPSAKTMQRRIDAEFDPLTRTAARQGIQAAMRKVPSIIRDESVYLAGQAVSGDGLKFDKLWIRFPDGEVLNTATGWFYQDVRTRRLLAWRLGKTESTDLFRLATYDLTGICAPEVLVLDNTRVAANLLMTGGVAGRRRFGQAEHHGTGLLPMLGMTVQFTNPDKEVNNPGAKPVERAFGIGGLHEKVATNPEIRTFGGYSSKTAVPFEVFRRVVALEVARHNAQEGRRNRAAGGKLSLDQAWEQSPKCSRVLSATQRRLLLMCRELVKVQQGVAQVAIKAGRNAHGANRYTADGISRYAGRQVYVHYDPEALHAGAWLYDLQGRYLMALEHIPTHAFNAKAAGDEVAKIRHRTRKALKKATTEAQRMDAIERAQLYGEATAAQPAHVEAPSKADQTVVQGHFQAVPAPERDAEPKSGTPGQVLAGPFALAPSRKVLDDGTVLDTHTGEVIRAGQPADGSLTAEEIEQRDFLRAVAAAQQRNRW